MARLKKLISALFLAAVSMQGATPSVPVLLELFTSEGCSSCPPADRLLSSLDHEQPVAGADLIVISEHVDYWNQLGWIDPNSSKLFSKRQSDYAARFGTDDVYTPQLLIDGAYAVVGSNRAEAGQAIRKAQQNGKLPLSLRAERNGDYADVHISIDSPAQWPGADVFLVLARDSVSTRVTAGENSGRALTHTAVAFSFQKAGHLESASFKRELRAPLGTNGKGPLRIIVFAQDKKTGRIVGAAQVRL